MKALLVSAAFGVGALIAQGAYAQDAHTALCKDGTYFDGATHKGACKGHQGVKEWLDNASAKSAAPTAAAASTAPAPRPADATAMCKDGSYINTTEHKGACRGHKGVQEWFTTAATTAPAATPAGPAPAGTTALCKDGTYSHGMTKIGACLGHKGIQEWYGKAGPTAATATAATTAAAKEHHAPTPASQIAQKPGGGLGLVWLNTESKVYHCMGDEWYGKTKEGSYMSATEAEKAGGHASHGKACTTK